MAVKRSLAWMAGSQMASFVLQFAASVAVARLLTPYELGVYAVAMAVVGALALIQAVGLGNLIVREADLSKDIIANVFTINLILSLALSGAIAGIGYAGAAFFRDPHVRDVLLVLALTPLPGIFDFMPAARFEREGDFRAISVSAALRAGSNAILTIAFALAGFTFLGLAAAQVLSVLCATLYLTISGRRFLSFELRLSRWREILGYGLQLLAVAGMTSTLARGSDIVLGRLLGLPALGVFNRASSLNSLVADRFRMTVERVIFSHFSARSRAGEPLRPVYLYTVEMMSAVLWPAFGGLAVLAAPIISNIYGDRWLSAAAPLALLALASLIQVSITLTWELFLINRELKRQARIEFVRTAISFSAFSLACTISLTAAAAARILDALVANLLYRRHIQRMTGTRFSDFLPIYARSAFLTILAAGPGVVVTFVCGPRMSLARLGAIITVGVCLWAGGLVLLRHPLLMEVLATVRGRSRRVLQRG